MLSPGPERWHPGPQIFYQRGAGPMFDMGPYYFTALVALLGPARRITSAARITHAQRDHRQRTAAWAEDRRWKCRRTSRASSTSSVGPIATLVTSFDVQASRNRFIEIYGTEGTLAVPDPNTFGGTVQIKRGCADEWQTVPLTHGNASAKSRHRSCRHGDRDAQRPCASCVGRACAACARSDGECDRRIRARAPRDIAYQVRAARAACRPDFADDTFDGVRDIMTLRYGIIGGGFITGFQLRALTSVRGVEVAGLVSRTPPEQHARFVRQHELGAGTIYRSIAEMVPNVDVLAFFGPNFTRVAALEEAAQAVRARREVERADLRKATRTQSGGGRQGASRSQNRSAHRPRISKIRST